MAYKEFKDKIVNLQNDVNMFRVNFLDRNGFKRFADDLRGKVQNFQKLCITGYFSETIREQLEDIVTGSPITNVRLICPNLNVKRTRDRKNLQALRKLSKAEVEIRINDRLHARFLVAHDIVEKPLIKEFRGLLLIGSFDFNTECIGRERYDAGIMTRHPDLVKSAVELFEQIWNEPESIPLKDFDKKPKGS